MIKQNNELINVAQIRCTLIWSTYKVKSRELHGIIQLQHGLQYDYARCTRVMHIDNAVFSIHPRHKFTSNNSALNVLLHNQYYVHHYTACFLFITCR